MEIYNKSITQERKIPLTQLNLCVRHSALHHMQPRWRIRGLPEKTKQTKKETKRFRTEQSWFESQSAERRQCCVLVSSRGRHRPAALIFPFLTLKRKTHTRADSNQSCWVTDKATKNEKENLKVSTNYLRTPENIPKGHSFFGDPAGKSKKHFASSDAAVRCLTY